MRRNGAWQGDLNSELALEYLVNLVESWRATFDGLLGSNIRTKIKTCLSDYLRRFVEKCPEALKPEAEKHVNLALDAAVGTMAPLNEQVRFRLTLGRKTASRRITPAIAAKMCVGYSRAVEEVGPGRRVIQRQRVSINLRLRTTTGSSALSFPGRVS